MTVIAVAGGSDGLGRSIVEELQGHGGYDVLVLSRKPNPSVEKTLGCRVAMADYSNTEALVKLLEEQKVHTLISTVNALDNTDPEINLMHAADRSTTTRRYIPSIWGSFHYEDEHGEILPVVRGKRRIIKELERTSSLEYSAFYIGYFLDYFGNGRVKSHLMNVPIVIDVANEVAGIPGSGTTPVAFTHSSDVARFTVASLELPKWEPESWIIGDKLTWNEFLELAESTKGTKFSVTYDSLSDLRQGKITELPGQRVVYEFWPKEEYQWLEGHFGVWFHEGLFDLKPKQTLNDVFQSMKTMSAKELLERSWKE